MFEVGFLSTTVSELLYWYGKSFPDFWLAIINVLDHFIGDVIPVAYMLYAHHLTFRIVQLQ